MPYLNFDRCKEELQGTPQLTEHPPHASISFWLACNRKFYVLCSAEAFSTNRPQGRQALRQRNVSSGPLHLAYSAVNITTEPCAPVWIGHLLLPWPTGSRNNSGLCSEPLSARLVAFFKHQWLTSEIFLMCFVEQCTSRTGSVHILSATSWSGSEGRGHAQRQKQ